MTLEQYLSTMKTLPRENPEGAGGAEEDLYETSRKKGKQKYSSKLIPYEIRECDEDNYEEAGSQAPPRKSTRRGGRLAAKEELTISYKNITYNLSQCERHKRTEMSKEFKVRRQSHSPYLSQKKATLRLPQNKILSQTHFLNNEWK
jgi:hypothetical protein